MTHYKNVLIVLGYIPKKDGRPDPRMVSNARKTIQLCKKNKYSKIILSGGPTRGVPESEMMRIMLLNYIEQKKVLIERKSMTTVQNALFCWEMLKDKNPKNITIIAARYHVPRVRYIFRSMFSHMGVSLKFESAHDMLDPIEYVFYRVKEQFNMIGLKLFGIR